MQIAQHLVKSLILIFILFPIAGFSQRNAPVVGDAAKLVDFLKKDYSSISLDRRKEEITKDQGQVISYFKSYMTDLQKKEFHDDIDTPAFKTLDSAIQSAFKMKSSYNSQLSVLIGQVPKDAEKHGNKVRIIKDSLIILGDTLHQQISRSNRMKLKSIKDVFSSANNNFIESVVQLFSDKYQALDKIGTDQFAAINHSSSIKKAIPFIGGDLSFEMLMDGLGRFLAQRLKDELTAHVFSKIHEWLDRSDDKDPFAELKAILPRTTTYLKNLEASGISTFGEEIKQYIEDDLNHLLENTVHLKDTPRFKNWLKTYPDLDFAFEALEIIPAISELKNPIEYFALLENSRNITRWKVDDNQIRHNLANTIQFSSMLAHSLMIMDDNESRFAGTNFLSAYVGEETFMKLYIGFLHQQNEKYYDIHFLMNGKDKLKPVELKSSLHFFMTTYDAASRTIESKKQDLRFFKDIIMELGEKGETVYQNAIEIRRLNKLNGEVKPELVHDFIDGLIGMTEHASYACDTTINYLFNSYSKFGAKIEEISSTFYFLTRSRPFLSFNSKQYSPLNLSEKTKPYLSMAKTCNDAFMDVVDKKYALAILKILEVSGNLVSPESELTIFSKIQEFKDKLFANSELLRDLSLSDLETFLVDSGVGVAITPNAEIKATANKLFSELSLIMSFGKEAKCLSVGLEDSLTYLRENLALIATSVSWTIPSQSDLDKMVGVFSNRQFQKLLLSYYGGMSIELLTKEVKQKLIAIQFQGGIKPFTEVEANNFANLFNEYATTLYNHCLTETFRKEKKARKKLRKELEEINTKLTSLMKGYLLILPQKLNWEIDPNVIKIVHFINDVAMAKDGEEIEAVIEQFALPPGSSSIKRKSKFNASINAYPGILGGFDVTFINNVNTNAFALSFTAPVGLNLGWGGEKGGSFSLFVPIVDVGAITRFRFDNDTTTTLLTGLRFQDVFAPGIYGSIGFRNSPLSLNVGAQYGPELRMIQSDGSAKFFPSMRFGVGLVVDIPLLNLHTKPRF